MLDTARFCGLGVILVQHHTFGLKRDRRSVMVSVIYVVLRVIQNLVRKVLGDTLFETFSKPK